MANGSDEIKIYGSIRCKTADGKAAFAQQVYDEEQEQFQSEINQGVTEKYGDYFDIPEFLSATTDADGKMLEGIRKDGTKVFAGNIDAPNIRELDAYVTQAKSQAQTASTEAQTATTAAQTATTAAQTATTAAQQASVVATQASNEAQQASAATQQTSEQIASLSEDVTQAKSQAQSAVEQTQQLSQDVVEKYGDYLNEDQYLSLVTDEQDNMLEGIRKDGTKVFFGRVTSPNIEDTEQKVEQMEEPVSFLDTMLSEEWAEVSVDDNQHILYGVKKDGTVYIYKLESPILEEKIKTIVTDLIGNIGKDINLQPSSFIPSEVKNRNGDATIPTFDDITIPSSSVIEVNSQSDYDTAIATLTSTQNTSAILNLHTDVKRTQAANIAQGNTLIINGNGHHILGWNAEYTATSIKGDKAYCAYTGNLYGSNIFVSPTGAVLRLARTKCYKAASRIIAADTIEDADGNEIFHEGDNFPRTHRAFSEYTANGVTYHMDDSCVYHCKFQLPASLADIEIASTDGVYINLTTDWASVQMPVIKVKDGWLYFDYVYTEKDYDPNTALVENNLGIDNDWWVWHSNGLGDTNFTSFYLINYQIEDDHSCLIKTIDNTSTLIFPSKYAKVAESYTEIFKLNGANINFKISDATLVGYRALRTYSTALDVPCGDRVVLDGCVIKGCVRSAVLINGSESGGYMTRCEAYDCDMTVLYCMSSSNNVIVATHNYIHDIGNRRLNTYGIEAYGLTNYIAYNRIADFGYGAIRTGIWSEKNPVKVDGEWTEEDTGTYCESSSIIEYNTVYQTPEYFQNKAQHFVTMDAGAIYNAVHNKEAIIRHNIIYNYTGRGFNRGMYLDGGCYNIYVYSNIVANTPMSWSINAYYAEDTSYVGLPYTIDNVSKYICNNYVENGIKIGGRANYPNDISTYDEFIASHSYEVGDCITGVDNGITYYLICVIAHTSASDFSTERSTNSNKWSASSPNKEYYRGEYPDFEANKNYAVGNIVKGVDNGSTIYLMCSVAHTSEVDFATELSVNGDKWDESVSYDGEIKSGWIGQVLQDNHCYLGHNIINSKMLRTKSEINDIADSHLEEQYYIDMPSYQNGTFSTSLDIVGWLNKL